MKGDPRAGRRKGVQNKVTREVRDLARAMVQDEAYLTKLTRDLHAGKLPTQLVVMLWHYAYGKPKETHEISGPGGLPLLDRIEVVIVDGKSKD